MPEPTVIYKEPIHTNGTATFTSLPQNGKADIDVPVLMYHRIIDNRVAAKDNWLCVHVDVFDKQLRMLELWGYSAITFSDYYLYMQGKLILPRKPIIITIDDGYLDTYTHALPLLKQYGMRAVVFVLGDRGLHYNKWDEHKGIPPAALMNNNQILELYREGIEIGAHSLSHPDLSCLPKEKAWKEINRSKTLLQEELGIEPIAFCYPYGGVSPLVKQLVQESGFQFACSVFSGPAQFRKDLFEIRRITVRNKLTDLALRLMIPQKIITGLREGIRKNKRITEH